MSVLPSLILANSTFNNTEQLKLLGFTNLTHVLIDRHCSILIRLFLYEHGIQTTEIDIKHDQPRLEDIYLFYDGHGNTSELLLICDKFKAAGANLYIFESPFIDPRSGSQLY